MKNHSMGSGAAMGQHNTNSKRAFAWLWHSWVQAEAEVPLLRWLSVAAVMAAGAAVYLAFGEGKTVLDMAVYGMITLLFVAVIPAIYYLLFEVYRAHRSDAIFDSKRLSELIRRYSREEIELSEEAKLKLENNLLLLQEGRGARK